MGLSSSENGVDEWLGNSSMWIGGMDRTVTDGCGSSSWGWILRKDVDDGDRERAVEARGRSWEYTDESDVCKGEFLCCGGAQREGT